MKATARNQFAGTVSAIELGPISAQVTIALAAGADILTIEGLAAVAGMPGDVQHPVQRAWIDEQVPQCGYCQPGMIMAVASFLKTTPDPDDAAINDAITNICRCGTYPRIRKAIHRAAAALRAGPAASGA